MPCKQPALSNVYHRPADRLEMNVWFNKQLETFCFQIASKKQRPIAPPNSPNQSIKAEQ
jgi:hypothetical protein